MVQLGDQHPGCRNAIDQELKKYRKYLLQPSKSRTGKELLMGMHSLSMEAVSESEPETVASNPSQQTKPVGRHRAGHWSPHGSLDILFGGVAVN